MTEVIARSTVESSVDQMTRSGWQMEEKCLKTLSEYRVRRCRCHMWWKTVPEGGTRNRKSPFADGREVDDESLQTWSVSWKSESRNVLPDNTFYWDYD